MLDQTPEQREAALSYARFCMRSDVHPTFMERDLSRTALDLYAEVVKLREALAAMRVENQYQIDDINAALSGSPAPKSEVPTSR